MPLVSFFVQAYNTEPFLAACLESILAQKTFSDFEIILIDDASTDGTTRIAKSFTDPRLRCLRHERNTGAIATANEGYGLARGEFVARIDSDDCYRPTFLEKTVPILQANPAVGLVYGDIAMIDVQGKVTVPGGMVTRHGLPAQGNEFFPLLEENYIPAPSTLMRRAALQTLLPIPADYQFLDWYLTTGITERHDSAFVNAVLADYRIHGANMHRTMIRDRTGEATTFKILDAVFASHVRREEKQQQRRRVYAKNYLVYADKYFGCEMNADARRCYWRAIRFDGALLCQMNVLRRLLATFVPRRLYEGGKGLVRRGRTAQL